MLNGENRQYNKLKFKHTMKIKTLVAVLLLSGGVTCAF